MRMMCWEIGGMSEFDTRYVVPASCKSTLSVLIMFECKIPVVVMNAIALIVLFGLSYKLFSVCPFYMFMFTELIKAGIRERVVQSSRCLGKDSSDV